MSAFVRTVIHCNAPGCPRYFITQDWTRAIAPVKTRKQAKEKGWMRFDGDDFCPICKYGVVKK